METTNKYFPNDLKLKEIGYGKWQLLEDYIFRDPVTKTSFIVPKNFITDLYSIPSFLRGMVSRVQNANGPSVVHDYLYQTMWFGSEGRREADAVLARAMELHWCPVSKYNAKKINLGLKIGGWATYKKKTQSIIQLAKDLNLDLAHGERPSPPEIIALINAYDRGFIS